MGKYISQAQQSKTAVDPQIKTPAVKRPALSLTDNRPKSVLQKKQAQEASAHAGINETPVQKKANNTGLPDQLKSGIENLSGHSMDDVKVHYHSARPAQLNAHAYAQGTDIHIASGQEKHLPHEAWHVVQQKQGRVKPTMQLRGKVNINDDTGLEKEADIMGAKAVQVKTAHAIQRKAGYPAGPYVAQLEWIRVEDEPHATEQWSEPKDGVIWFSNGTDMWFRIVHAGSIRKGTHVDYQALEGYENRKTWAAWNAISVEPDMEWIRQINRPASINDDGKHEAMLRIYQQKYGAGVKLWSALQKALANSHRAPDENTEGMYAGRYNTRLDRIRQDDLSVTAKDAMKGHADDGGYVSAVTAAKGQTHAYSNLIHPHRGVIIADYNFAKHDVDSEHTGRTKRINNSEILYHQYKGAGGNLAHLSQIVRSNIVNPETVAILSLMQRRAMDKFQERTWTPANPEFYALLGTDNVKGVTFLLGQHARETHGKTIINMVTKGIAYIKINLG